MEGRLEALDKKTKILGNESSTPVSDSVVTHVPVQEELVRGQVKQELVDREKERKLQSLKRTMGFMGMRELAGSYSEETLVGLFNDYAVTDEMHDQVLELLSESSLKEPYVNSITQYMSGIEFEAREAEKRNVAAILLYSKRATELRNAIKEGGEKTAELMPLFERFISICDSYTKHIDAYMDADVQSVFDLAQSDKSECKKIEETIKGHQRWIKGVEVCGSCYIMMAGNLEAMASVVTKEEGIDLVKEGLSSLEDYEETEGEDIVQVATPFYGCACKVHHELTLSDPIDPVLTTKAAEYCEKRKKLADVIYELDTVKDIGVLRSRKKREELALTVTTNPETRRDIQEEIDSLSRQIRSGENLIEINLDAKGRLESDVHFCEENLHHAYSRYEYYNGHAKYALGRRLDKMLSKKEPAEAPKAAEHKEQPKPAEAPKAAEHKEQPKPAEAPKAAEHKEQPKPAEAPKAPEHKEQPKPAEAPIETSDTRTDERVSEHMESDTTKQDINIEEARKKLDDLSASTEELQRRLTELAARECRLESKYSEPGYNSCMTFMKGELPTYIPKEATGRLDDYVVNGEKVEGVGKAQVFWEKLTFGIKTSKLNERIGKHVKRFLNSGYAGITEKDVCATATEVVRAGGLFGDSFMKECSKEGLIFERKFKADILGENTANRLNLLAEIANADSQAPMDDYIKRATELIGEGNQDELQLSEEYFTRFGYASKTILMYRLIRGIDVSGNSVLNKKFKGKFEDRIKATMDNLQQLNEAVVNSPDYQYALVRRQETEIKAQIANDVLSFNELNEDLKWTVSDITVADNPQELLNSLRLGIASAERAYSQAVAARNLQAAERERIAREKREPLDESRIVVAREQARKEAAKRIAATLAEDKNKLLTKGVAKNGYVHKEWYVSEYADRVQTYLGEEVCDGQYDVYSSKLCDVNEKIKNNLKLIDRYLDSKAVGTSKERLFANEKLRKLAVSDVAANMDDRLFKVNNEESLFTHLLMLLKTIRLKNFDDAVGKAKKLISHIPGMEGMEEAVLMSEGALEILLEGDKAKIKALLDRCKASYEINMNIVKEACRELPESIRDESAKSIAERIVVQMLNASPDSIAVIAHREVAFLSIFNPEIFETDRRVRVAAAKAGASERAICMLKMYDKDLLKKWDEEKAKAKLTEYERMISEEFGMIADTINEQLQAIILECDNESDRSIKGELTEAEEDSLHKMFMAVLYYRSKSEQRLELKKKVMAELEMHYVNHRITKSGLKKKAKDLIIQIASDEQNKLDFESLRGKKTIGDGSVYEDLVIKELFMDRHFGSFISNNIDYYMSLIKEQMVKDKLDGITSTSEIASVRPAKMKEYIEVLRDRLSVAEVVLGDHLETIREDYATKQILGEMIAGVVHTYDEWVEYGKRLNAESLERGKILSQREILMLSGKNWTSHRAYIDMFSQKINTGRGVQFRGVNRKYRMRDIWQRTREAAEGNEDMMPRSFYEYATNHITDIKEIASPERLNTLRSEWKKSLDEWARVFPQKREEIAKELQKVGTVTGYRQDVYYGLSTAMNVILRGVETSVNEEDRREFEDRLERTGMVYYTRVATFDAECLKAGITGDAKEDFKRNIEEYFADTQEEYNRTLIKVRQTHGDYSDEQAISATLDELERQYGIKLGKAIAMYKASVIGPGDSQHTVKDKRRLQNLIERKDRRFEQIAMMDEGIYAPLLHIIAGGGKFRECILADKEERYQKHLKEFIKKVHEPMELLCTSKSVYHAFIDQYLIRFGDDIMSGKLKKKEDAKEAFEKYYREIITHEFVSDKGKKTTIDSLIHKAQDKKTAEEANREGNLVIQVMLYEGALEIADAGKMKVYRSRLERNTKVLERVLDEIYQTEAYRQYIAAIEGQKATGLDKELKDRTEALKATFRDNMLMEEREYIILTDSSEIYEEELRGRMARMLRISDQVRTQTDKAGRKMYNTKEEMKASIIADKVEGRRVLREEKADFDIYNDYATKRISPVMAAYGLFADAQGSNIQKVIAQQVSSSKSDVITKGLLADVLVSKRRVLSNSVIPVIVENIRRIRELSGLDVTRTSDRIILQRVLLETENIDSEELTKEQIEEKIRGIDGHVEIGELLNEISLMRTRLPKDGLLNSFYSDAVTKASYKAFERDTATAKKELEKIFVSINNRIVMAQCIENYITENLNELLPAEKISLRAGLFDLYATEYAKGEVLIEYDTMWEAFERRFESVKGSEIALQYIMDDRGRYASVDGEKGVGEIQVFAAQVTREEFEEELKKYAKNPLIKEYMELSIEDKVFFGHVAGCDKVVESRGMSLSLDSVYRMHAYTYFERNIDEIISDYVSGKEITAAADYANVRRSLYVDGKPDNEAFENVLKIVRARRAEKLSENVDIGLLATSAAETIRVMGREEAPHVSDTAKFFEVLHTYARMDSVESDVTPLIGAMERLEDYQLQLLLVVLSDRTALDERFDGSGAVNKARRGLLEKNLDKCVNSVLAMTPPGEGLLNRVLSTLMSFRIREDVIIKGEIQKSDLYGTERKTVLDYELLRKAYKMIQQIHS